MRRRCRQSKGSEAILGQFLPGSVAQPEPGEGVHPDLVGGHRVRRQRLAATAPVGRPWDLHGLPELITFEAPHHRDVEDRDRVLRADGQTEDAVETRVSAVHRSATVVGDLREGLADGYPRGSVRRHRQSPAVWAPRIV